jgi:hypothetical protein
MFHVKHVDSRGAPTPEFPGRDADAPGRIRVERRSTEPHAGDRTGARHIVKRGADAGPSGSARDTGVGSSATGHERKECFT